MTGHTASRYQAPLIDRIVGDIRWALSNAPEFLAGVALFAVILIVIPMLCSVF